MGTTSWKDFLADARGGSPPPVVGLGIPDEMGGDLSMGDVEPATEFDVEKYLAGLVNDQMDNRDFSSAA
jgi:hypothetical protein